MIKIGFIINYITNNGPSNVVLDIINNLDKKQYEIYLLTLVDENDTNIINSLENKDIHVYTCKKTSRLEYVLGCDKELSNFIKSNRFDILHSHGFLPDIVCARLNTSAKTVSTVHNNMFEDYIQTYGKVKGKIFIKLHIKALKHLDKCVGCSFSVYKSINKYVSRSTYIHNGIHQLVGGQELVERRDLSIPEDAIVYLYVGVLNYRKNVEFLINNFVKNHTENEYLLIVGDGERREECARASDEHVRMLGYKGNPSPYYFLSNIYTSASKSEGFSMSLLEALSTGLGLFVSNIPSHQELFEYKNHPYLGQTFDIDKNNDFQDKIMILRGNYNKISKDNIKKFQCENFSDTSMEKKYDELYKNLLKESEII